MYVKLTLEVRGAFSRDERELDPRTAFWNHIRRLARGGDVDSDPEYMESRLYSKLGERLTEHLRKAIREPPLQSALKRFRSRRYSYENGSVAEASIRVHVENISYGSIDFLLNVIGITDETVQQQVLTALLAFGPVAFQQVMGVPVPLEASVERVMDNNSRGGSAAVNWPLWALANGSLLVPFGLALYVCYVAFNALMHEMEGVRSENQSLRTERTELVKAVIDHNAKLSAVVVNQANNLGISAKAMEELQSTLVKGQAKALGILPADKSGSKSVAKEIQK
jgi:hypothetical protein